MSLLLIIVVSAGCGGGGGGNSSSNGDAVDNGNYEDNGENTTYEPEPVLSEMPNGERILFVKRFRVSDTPFWELYSMDSGGGDVRRHSEIAPDGFSISMPELAHDGKTITFSSNHTTWLSSFYRDIFLWDLTSDFVYRLTGDQRPNLPDNTTAVTVNVVYPPEMVFSASQIRVSFKGCANFVHPSPYTATSNALKVDQVVLNVPADEDIWIKAEVSSGKGDIKFVRISKGSAEVVQLDLRNGTLHADFPGASPDGNWVACAITSSDTDFECSKLAVYSRDGSILYEENVGGMTQCGDTTPVFSPDGTQIAYCPGQPASTGLGILSISDPTAPPKMLFTSSFANGYPISSFPAWSPDGNYIIFNITYVNGLAVSSNLFKIPSVGGPVEQLTFYSGNTIAGKASYSPDGTKIALTLLTSNNPDYFSFAEEYTTDIYVMPSSGGPTTRITHDGNSKDPSWGKVNT
jgi:Tol biopolymer transport system component